MTDLSTTIAPKSDQLNADDLIGTTKNIKITGVALCLDPEQPVAISYEGDGGKPFKPCKTMRRILVHVWGRDGSAYIGRSLVLYRDEKVKFGGFEVGGIRISHMSHIDRDIAIAVMTNKKAGRRPYIVRPLIIKKDTASPKVVKDEAKAMEAEAKAYAAQIDAVTSVAELDGIMRARSEFMGNLFTRAKKWHERLVAKAEEKRATFKSPIEE